MILTLDAGNSRTKWALFDEAGEIAEQGVIDKPELATVVSPLVWRNAQRVLVSNVAGPEVQPQIERLLAPVRLTIHWFQPSASAGGVRNRYDNPQQLGSDRWAALIAAWQQYHQPCVVVSAGTAVTVDALARDGVNDVAVFLGGFILPGLNLMRSSLLNATADLAARAEPMAQAQDFPTNTGSAIRTGALAAIVGAVGSMLERLRKQAGVEPLCIIGGGDGALIADLLENEARLAKRVVIADNLVLQGLFYIGRGVA